MCNLHEMYLVTRLWSPKAVSSDFYNCDISFSVAIPFKILNSFSAVLRAMSCNRLNLGINYYN